MRFAGNRNLMNLIVESPWVLRLIQRQMSRIENPRKISPTRKWLMGITLLAVILAVSGCQTLSFYGQAIRGQYQLLAHRQPIEKLVADSSTPPRLKTQLELLQKLRAFAGTELKLPVDG